MHPAGRGRLQPGQGIVNLLPLHLLSVIGVPTILAVAFATHRNRRAGAWNTVIKKYLYSCRVVYSARAAKLRLELVGKETLTTSHPYRAA